MEVFRTGVAVNGGSGGGGGGGGESPGNLTRVLTLSALTPSLHERTCETSWGNCEPPTKKGGKKE